MTRSFQLENIQELRTKNGIVDPTLNDDIGKLKAGDSVRISLVTSDHGTETVTVRLTSYREGTGRGRLLASPKALSLQSLHVGSLMSFRATHVHSIIGRVNSASYAEPSSLSQAKRFRAPELSAPKKSERTSRASSSCSANVRRRPRRLRVEGSGRHLYIMVPIDLSPGLHDFLRLHRVRSSPPQPCNGDCDHIVLDPHCDAKRVQGVLDAWTGREAAPQVLPRHGS